MYLGQDRIDVQYCVKTLASSMKCPTQQAEKALIQLILYLAGTRDWAFKLPYVEAGTSLARILNTGRTDEGSSKEYLLEIFCDSDWAGVVGRKSAAACMIFLDSVLVTSFPRTQKSIALSSCESEVLALTAGCSEGILLRTIWEFLSQTACKVVARSDSSSGRQWLARSGVGRLKHFDIRLCWLQSAIQKKVLEVAPIGTKLNVSDLNTKKLSATRKRFLLYFLGATRFDEESGQQEAGGETEVVEHMTEEALKVQIQGISRLTRSKANRSILQVAMALSVFGMKGCMDNDEQQPVENNENSWQQVALTMVVLAIIALCNFVFSHWDVLQTLLQTMLDRRGRKRKRDVERQDEGQGQDAGEQQESSDVEVEELGVEGQASASSEPRPPSTSPPRGPPPRAPNSRPSR